MARQYLIPGVGYSNESTSFEYLIPGSIYTNETVSASTPTGWLAPTGEPLARRPGPAAYLLPQLATQATFAERVSPDKWQPLPNQPLFDVRRQQQRFPSAVLNPQPFGSPVFLDKWWQQPNAPVFRAENRYWFTPPAWTQVRFTEAVTADRWHPEIARPRFDLARNQYLYDWLTQAKLNPPGPVSGPPHRLQPINASARQFQTIL